MRRALSTLLIAAGVTVSAVAPASADPVPPPLPLPVIGQTYTDLRTPNRTLTGADLPVGAWRDAENRFHSSKAYFTVDLTRLRGTRVFTARVFSSEQAVNDCTKPRAVELWQTKVSEQPTWFTAPKELTKFEGSVTGDCRAYVSWEVTSAISEAVAAGRDRATFALRMAGGKQFDPGHGRRYAPVTVEVGYNTPPSAVTGPRVNAEPCDGREIVVKTSPVLSATATDPDPFGDFRVRYVVTDVADPAKRSEGTVSGTSPYGVPQGWLDHGHTYEWTAQGEDGYDRGPASAPCRFTADLRGPAKAPVVTTTDFPQTGAGFPGTFTFDAGGDEDAVAFSYLVDGQSGVVQADRPGGTATAALRFARSGPKRIEVRSVDRLGTPSEITRLDFRVRATWPTVTGPAGEAVLGSEVEVSFRSSEPGVTEFECVLNGVTTTVPAVDGAATARMRITDPWVTRPAVRARTAAGETTETGTGEIHTADSSPVITRAGDLFTFAPGMPGVVEYVYRVNSGREQVVAAGPDGTVTLPLDLGEQEFPPPSVAVSGRTADGLRSRTATYYQEF